MRKFTPRELNHLIKFGFDTVPFPLSERGLRGEENFPEDIPVEYITGKAEFRDQTFYVTKDTLIPRIETEQIIDLAIEKMKNEKLKMKNKIHFADVATGSGCIGISFAKELINKNISFTGNLTDISRATLLVAYDNASNLLRDKVKINFESKSNETNSINIFNSDLLGQYDQQLDLIFANLPYVPSSRIALLDNSVKDFEPHLALDGGEDGLDLIRKLLEQSIKLLNPNGFVILEVDDTHTNTQEFANTWKIEIIKDFNNKTRFWICTKKP